MDILRCENGGAVGIGIVVAAVERTGFFIRYKDVEGHLEIITVFILLELFLGGNGLKTIPDAAEVAVQSNAGIAVTVSIGSEVLNCIEQVGNSIARNKGRIVPLGSAAGKVRAVIARIQHLLDSILEEALGGVIAVRVSRKEVLIEINVAVEAAPLAALGSADVQIDPNDVTNRRIVEGSGRSRGTFGSVYRKSTEGEVDRVLNSGSGTGDVYGDAGVLAGHVVMINGRNAVALVAVGDGAEHMEVESGIRFGNGDPLIGNEADGAAGIDAVGHVAILILLRSRIPSEYAVGLALFTDLTGAALIVDVGGAHNDERVLVSFTVCQIVIDVPGKSACTVAVIGLGGDVAVVKPCVNQAAPHARIGTYVVSDSEGIADLRIGDECILGYCRIRYSIVCIAFGREHGHGYYCEHHEDRDCYAKQSFGHSFFPPDIFGFIE